MQRDIVWRAYEHTHAEKTSDWFWALGIVAVSSAVVAMLFNNILFAILILVAAGTMTLLAQRPPQEREFALTRRGILIDRQLFPYQLLASFYVKETVDGDATLIVDARRFMVPHIIVPLEDVDPLAVHEYLLEYLPEVEMDEPLAQRILEKFGL